MPKEPKKFVYNLHFGEREQAARCLWRRYTVVIHPSARVMNCAAIPMPGVGTNSWVLSHR